MYYHKTSNDYNSRLSRLVDHCKWHHCSTSQRQRTVSKCTAPSSNVTVKCAPKRIPPGVRIFSNESVGSAVIGRGTFGTCFLANLGPLRCKKVHRSEPKYLSYFYNELSMLMQLCHENLPFLYGAYVQGSILMSLHLFTDDGKVKMHYHKILNQLQLWIGCVFFVAHSLLLTIYIPKPFCTMTLKKITLLLKGCLVAFDLC